MAATEETWAGRCLTCKHWMEEKPFGGLKPTLEMIAERGDVVMDRRLGWPLSGSCGIAYDWCELEISGDASVSMEIQANFGCVWWEAV
jgi:hypothetical protein